MSEPELILGIVVATALVFDFTNGFHDTANVVATSISTRAMAPRIAVGYAAVLNFAGAFISLEVAATIAEDVVDPLAITTTVIFAGLIGAIAWNLITWYFGLPSSSSHALIGGVVGSTFVAAGADAVFGEGILGKVLIPALVAPVLAFVVGACRDRHLLLGRRPPAPGPVSRGFRFGQVISGGLLALAHGTNDAQKTMGVIALALIASGHLGDRRGPAAVGDRLRRVGDRARDLHGRLADHPHDGLQDHQDGPGAGVLGPGRRRRGDPRLLALRLPALDDSGDRGRGDGRRGRQAALRGPLGRRRQHRHRLVADPSRGRDDRRDHVSVHRPVPGRAGPRAGECGRARAWPRFAFARRIRQGTPVPAT